VTRVKRTLAALGAVAVLVSVGAIIAGGGAQASAPAPRAAAASLTWSGCGDLECATLAVPRDYAHPGAGTVTLALTRKVHTASPYRGMLLLNPGGPGASGTGLPELSDYVPNGAGANYDWVGFDPRGVGQSTPSLHCDPSYVGADRPDYVPTTRHLMNVWITKTTRYAQACGRSAAKAILPFVSTRDSVRDMESIRAAYEASAPVGDRPTLEKLNFYGFSYGTYLGEVYAVTYPSRVGRFILDGVMDPTTYWYKSNLEQEIRFELNLHLYFRWLAAHPAVFHLGTDPSAILRGFRAELRTLAAHPAAGGRLGPDELRDAMLQASYYVFGWDSIGAAYAALINHGRGLDLFRMYAANNMGADNENGYAMYLATQCSDVLRPSWTTQVRDAWRINASYPFQAWDNTWYNAPCRFWPAPSRSLIGVNGNVVTAKILLINETFDAATPFVGALTARGLFPSASLIEGVNGTTHAGSLSGVPCVDNRIASYLTDGTVPTRLAGRRSDFRCPRVPPPQVGARTLARPQAPSRTGVPPALRARMIGAQAAMLGL
jgi:pimeloyl-ACP methyl ester carboxylesterase